MAFSMKGWVVRKKRTTERRGRNMFNKLPRDIQTDILKRLGDKDLSKAMCVSNSWRDLILDTILPKNPETLVTFATFPHPFLGLDELFDWCSTVMCCSVTPQKLIDSCKGLLLFCHNEGEAENLTLGVYHYYVVNYVTKQCVAVLKPSGTFSAGYSFAALAYDPAESWFFKIVRFQGCRHINVFSSETGLWITLTLHLPLEVNESEWMKKCVYAKGALYRLSNSGHIIKILVEPQENVEDQAVALRLPPTSLFDNCHWDIGVRASKVMFIMSVSVYIIIYKLVESVEGGVHSFTWHQIRMVDNLALWKLNSYGQLLSYHPCLEVVFFKRKNLLLFYSCGNNSVGPRVISYDEFLYDYLKNCGLPLLECSIPFACCLDKEHPRLFQRLRVPDISEA